VVYQVTPWLGEECLRHYAALTSLLGDSISQALIVAVSKEDKIKKPLDYLKEEGLLDKDAMDFLPAVGKAFSTLTQKLDPDEFLKLSKALLKNVRIEADKPRPINFNLDFGGGRMKPLFKLLLFVLEVNFKDFLPSGTDLMSAVKGVAEQAVTQHP